jgi:hypothetical protein
MRYPKAVQKGQVLDPCWTLKLKMRMEILCSFEFIFRSEMNSNFFRSASLRVIFLEFSLSLVAAGGHVWCGGLAAAFAVEAQPRLAARFM